MAHFPHDTLNVNTLPDEDIRYSFCTLVTKPEQYAEMVDSFRSRGFDGDSVEFLYADNTQGNSHDGYSGLGKMIHKSRGKYVVLVHQDVLAIDNRTQLDTALEELTSLDPTWALAGNAGSTIEGKPARRLTSVIGYNEYIGKLPAKVETLDEDILILRRDATLAPSCDLSGFHLYGTDLVQQAIFRGRSAYVIDFHVEHLGLSEIDEAFITAIDAFRDKYRWATRPKLLSTPVTHVGFGREFLKSFRHRRRIMHEAAGTKPIFDLPALRRKLSDAKYLMRDDARGARYDLDGTTFQLPKHSPVAAIRAILAGNYEKPERDLSRKWLPKDLPVVELGGAYGIVSNLLRNHLNPGTQLIVVEANPDLIDICNRNIGDVDNEHTTVLNAALAYDSDVVRFTITNGLHTSHVATECRADEGHEIEVPATSLVDLLKSQKIEEQYCLVCDIEGEEFELFLKDKEALKHCAVAIVEFHPDPFVRRGVSTSAFFDHVRSVGFEIVETRANVLVAKRAN
ncbi:FkbM family methyltransferase [Roseovarius sp. A21]|uniref:FkbM family methyltransferase n=1 Tax=Roseovarius bejariae TaxID=2576383 RepID=A0A844D199_9RHOB|nr:FkbM family methyltransferase [Roseovarius bejariae]MRU14958.1 FkbM family methyltransferase [Roseovarius bejariae]